MWDSPGPGIETVSPALAGRFFTTEPAGRPLGFYLCEFFLLLLIIQSLLIKAYSDFVFFLESVSMLCLSGNLSVSSKLFSFVDMLLFIVFLESFLFL